MNELNTEVESEAESQVDRLDELLSLFFDDCLSEEQVAELNELMLSDPGARARSFDAAQLHADLYSFFRDKSAPVAPALPLAAGLAAMDQPAS